MGDIFTYLTELVQTSLLIHEIIWINLTWPTILTPVTLSYFIKYLIGYCHFYNQLGWGLVFYIYFFRRYKAKKTNNNSTFYGNSILNWVELNFIYLLRQTPPKNIIAFFKSKYSFVSAVIIFFFKNTYKGTINLFKLAQWYKALQKPSNVSWTPVFKKTSYINILTFLKRFTKRK